MEEEYKYISETKKLEMELRLHTEAERLVEASLFVDRSFLLVAAARGDEKLEETFGMLPWHAYLEAKKMLYNNNELSLDLIENLYSIISKGDLKNEDIRNSSVRSLKEDQGELRENEERAYSQNPYIIVRGENFEEIVHPCVDDDQSREKSLRVLKDRPDLLEIFNSNPTTETLLKCLIQETCDYYNQAITEDLSTVEVVELAAEVQKNFASIHPGKDGNGRISRLIMNWILEKNGLQPTVLDRPDLDLSLTISENIGEIKRGQERYIQIKGSAEDQNEFGFEALSIILNDQERAFFETAFRPLNKIPSKRVQFYGKEVINYYRKYTNEWQNFKHVTQRDVIVNGEKVLSGGLIPVEYIDSVGDTRDFIIQKIRSKYATDTLLYRGNYLNDAGSAEENLMIFVSPTSTSAAYRTGYDADPSGLWMKNFTAMRPDAQKSVMRKFNELTVAQANVKAFSELSPLDTRCIEQERERLNQLKKLAENKSMIRYSEEELKTGNYLGHLSSVHTRGDSVNADPTILLSPAVSSSSRELTATSWSDGTLVISRLPKEGILYVPESRDIPLYKLANDSLGEEEVFTWSGIHPHMVETVVRFGLNGRDLKFVIERQNDINLVIYNFDDKTKNVYTFNRNGELDLKEKDIISANDAKRITDRFKFTSVKTKNKEEKPVKTAQEIYIDEHGEDYYTQEQLENTSNQDKYKNKGQLQNLTSKYKGLFDDDEEEAPQTSIFEKLKGKDFKLFKEKDDETEE